MTRGCTLLLAAALPMCVAIGAKESGANRDIAVVRDYITRTVGSDAISEIGRREGGKAFLKKFLSDQDWMEQFAGSGVCGGTPVSSLGTLAKSLKALDLLAWNDSRGFMDTRHGRNCATALALNHGHDWSDSKLVEIFDCFSEWNADGTLDDSCRSLDVHQWRNVMTFGQNSSLPVADLRWIHDFATIPPERYGGFVHGVLRYRLWNCFGDSVHGPMYYKPWNHRWCEEALRYRVGCVCGGISKFGSHGGASHGVQAFTAGQPGHCAYMMLPPGADRWQICNHVGGPTGAHFSLGGSGITAVEEQTRYYSHPKRMTAECYRWKGDYARSIAMVPGNWQAAVEWADKLEAENAPQSEWDEWAKLVRAGFRTAPSQGWQLYLRYLRRIGGHAARMAAAKLGLLAFTENPAPTPEPLILSETVYAPLAKCFDDKVDDLFALLPEMLDGQAKSPNFYSQTINWAATRLMDAKEHNRKFMTILVKNAEKNGTKIDFKNMILTAAANDDVVGFQQVFKLISKTSPDFLPKLSGKKYPEMDYGQPLVSGSGLLKISDSKGWDVPYNYLSGIVADDFAVDNAFHTHKSDNPWAMVVLFGDTEVTGITIVNSGSNGNNRRQVPLKVSVSMNGADWSEVWKNDTLQDQWRIALSTPEKARFIKVERPKDDARKEEPFHLHKILVYGRKLY